MKRLHQLTEPEVLEIKQLLQLCSENDKAVHPIHYGTNINLYREMPCYLMMYSDHLLVGYLSIFAINAFEGEICVIIHPSYRSKSIATELIEHAKGILKEHNYKQMLYVHNEFYEKGLDWINKKQLRHHHTEYTLTFDKKTEISRATRLLVSKAMPSDAYRVAQISVNAFEDDFEPALSYVNACFELDNRTVYLGKLNYEPICTLVVGNNNGELSINGVAVLKEHQGKGFGKEFISEVLHQINANYHEVSIDVDHTNLAAYELYKKIGFKEKSVTGYYVEPIDA
ncbi:MAG: hypothetical protein BGO41_03985 [Clostridiales bacterium 38-18]|nr:MAG: hypothetical protein BGO41_03985 [Clostridiales bacterium 38-18]